jgi:hypothetical protein
MVIADLMNEKEKLNDIIFNKKNQKVKEVLNNISCS